MRWRLYCWIFIISWLYQKSLPINNNWFEQTKRLDPDHKTIQQIEFAGQLKQLDANYNGTFLGGNDQFMLALSVPVTIIIPFTILYTSL